MGPRLSSHISVCFLVLFTFCLWFVNLNVIVNSLIVSLDLLKESVFIEPRNSPLLWSPEVLRRVLEISPSHPVLNQFSVIHAAFHNIHLNIISCTPKSPEHYSRESFWLMHTFYMYHPYHLFCQITEKSPVLLDLIYFLLRFRSMCCCWFHTEVLLISSV
jgi:hypothetical protein